jgi:hypothetical protein
VHYGTVQAPSKPSDRTLASTTPPRTLRNTEGIDQTFQLDELDEDTIKLKTSIMPSDLQKLMTVDELVDLVEYLQALKKK